MKRKETILVVEDDLSLRRLMTMALTDHSYHVLHANNGRDAQIVALQHRGPIHLLLTDIILIGPMDGIDLAQELRRSRGEIPAVYTSGYPLSYPERLQWEGLFDFFLAKSFSPRQLLLKVEACLTPNVVTA